MHPVYFSGTVTETINSLFLKNNESEISPQSQAWIVRLCFTENKCAVAKLASVLVMHPPARMCSIHSNLKSPPPLLVAGFFSFSASLKLHGPLATIENCCAAFTF
jgi:hypothetical protein